MDTQVQVQINALDNSKEAFASLNKNLEQVQKVSQSTTEKIAALQPTFQKMAVGGAAAFAGIVAGAKSSVNAYAEVERAQRQLSNAVIGVSKGTKEQLEQINALTGALEKKAGVDADSLTMGVAQLSTFGLSTDAVINLTKSLADLTVNQDGVNAGSEQYIANANVIAKALNGQFGILEKSGIRFTEAQKQMIEFGTESEKVAAINEGLAQNLRETTDTIDGIDLANAKAARGFENITENLGKGLAPAFAKISAVVVPVVEKFAAWAEENPKLVATIVIVAGALAGIVAVLGTIGLVIPAVVAGVTALGVAFTAASAALALVTLPMVAIGVAIAALVAGLVLLYQNWDTVVKFVQETGAALWQGLIEGFTKIAEVASTAWAAIKDVFFTYINFVVGLVATLLDWLVPNWEEKLSAMLTKATEILTAIGAFFSENFNALMAKLAEWGAMFAEVWRGVWDTVAAIFTEVWDGLKAAFDGAISWIKSGMEKLVAPIEKVIKLAEKAISLAKEVGGNIASKAKSTISDIISRGSEVTGKATGGSVRAGVPYIVGENGREMFMPTEDGVVIPNSRLSRMQGAGSGQVNNIVINVNGAQDPRAIAREVEKQLMYTLNKQGRYA